MKIACTTLGCPGWTLDDILKQLAASGYDGIDFRGLGDEMEVWKMPEFSRVFGSSGRPTPRRTLLSIISKAFLFAWP